jgi:hypothetical protein
MSTISHEEAGAGAAPERRRLGQLLVREAWAALAISIMWLTVLFDALFGPDIVSTNAGAQSSTVPSAVVVALFAWLATWVVAKYGFGDRDKHTG